MTSRTRSDLRFRRSVGSSILSMSWYSVSSKEVRKVYSLRPMAELHSSIKSKGVAPFSYAVDSVSVDGVGVITSISCPRPLYLRKDRRYL